MINLNVVRAVCKHALYGLVTHPTALIVTIGTVSASLSILAAALSLAFNLDELSKQWERGGEVLAFIHSGEPLVRYQQVATEVTTWPEVKKAELRTPQDARSELAEALGDSNLAHTLDLDVLPGTLEIEVQDGLPLSQRVQLRGRLLSLDMISEVESITEGRGLLAKLYEVRGALKVWVWLIGLWIASSVAFVIAQLVRLNLFHRRQELDVLLSVGASETFIKAPLMMEAAIQTSLGAILALTIIGSILKQIIDGGDSLMKLFQFEVTFLPTWAYISFIFGSALVGIFSSWRASHKFLRQER